MIDAHTHEGIREANADEARDAASELRSTICLAFAPTFNARPLDAWSDESLTEAANAIERELRRRKNEPVVGGGT